MKKSFKKSFKKFLFKHFTTARQSKDVVFIGQFQKGGLHKHSEAHRQQEMDFISNTLFQPKKYLTDVEIIEKVHNYIWGKKYYENCIVQIVEDTIIVQKGY